MAQQVLRCVSHLPAIDPTTDECSFSMTFVASGSDVNIDWSSLGPALIAFLNTNSSGASQAASWYISPEISRASNACSWEAYDVTTHLAGTPAGSPVHISNFTLQPSAPSTALPAGIAAVVSYRADYGSDVEFAPGSRPRSRDRNRFYFGPLNNAVLAFDSTTHRPKFIPQFVTDILANLSALSQLNTGLSNQSDLQVWSRKNAAVKEAESAWMDDRPDYQRRRADPSPATRTYVDLAS